MTPVEYFVVIVVIGVVSSNLPLPLSLKLSSLEGLYCILSSYFRGGG